jgi:phenylpyruvate tautomerase PptA (4-oxalocrotonate tautomerase family)
MMKQEKIMPTLDIEIVLRPGETLHPHLAAEIADRAGEILGTLKGATWVKLHPILSEHYAESGDGPNDNIAPVFVSILRSRLPEPEAMQAEVISLTEAIARICARPPENVHIIYEAAAAGRVAFGGKVVEG